MEKGELLAQIDDSIYKAQYDQATATLAHDKALLGTLTALRNQTKQEFERAKLLRPSQAIAETDYDTDEANFKAAEANLEVGKAQVLVSTAAAEMAKTNLNYCTITSPVKGVIINRGVNAGDTVISAMTVTSLFLIAKDLKRLQVWALVNEADMGQIHEGLPASFTVRRPARRNVSRDRVPDSPQRRFHLERGQLHGRGGDGQFQHEAPSLFDGERSVRSREAAQRAASAQRRLALEAAAGADRPRRATSGRRP